MSSNHVLPHGSEEISHLGESEATTGAPAESVAANISTRTILSVRGAVYSLVGLAALSGARGFWKIQSDMRMLGETEKAEILSDEASARTDEYLHMAISDPSTRLLDVADALSDLGEYKAHAFAKRGTPMDSIALWHRALELYRREIERIRAQDSSSATDSDTPDPQQRLARLEE